MFSQEGFNPQYGARPLKRVIQNKILNPIASLIISKGIMKGGIVSVSVKNNLPADEGGRVSFDIKRQKGAIIEASILDSVPEAVVQLLCVCIVPNSHLFPKQMMSHALRAWWLETTPYAPRKPPATASLHSATPKKCSLLFCFSRG